jgi:hypothetical protein
MTKTPETNEVLETMELHTPECEEVELTDEEIEDNVAPFRLDEQQFGFVALGLRNRMTSAVGESMQFVEMTGLTEAAQKALKDALKRSIWQAVRDHLKGIADISEIDSESAHKLIYGNKIGDMSYQAAS